MGANTSGQMKDGNGSDVCMLDYPVNNGTTFVTYYINLDRRPDRRQEIEGELERTGIKPYHRFSAVTHKNGAIGCTQSHVECLKLGIESGADHILVFEDDFVFTKDRACVTQTLQEVMTTNYDVFLLGYYVKNYSASAKPTNHPIFHKLTQASCTHGYMVSRRYAMKLLQNFALSVALLVKLGNAPLYALDQFWKRLQINDHFLCFSDGPLGVQRDGFSDIDKKVKLYKDLFSKQFDRNV